MNKDSTIEKLFPPLLRYGECFIDTRTRSQINTQDLSTNIEILFNFLNQFLLKYLSNECQKLLESFKKRELKLLGSQSQSLQYNNFQKKMAYLITDIVLVKIYKIPDKQIKNPPKYIIPIDFDNKGL